MAICERCDMEYDWCEHGLKEKQRVAAQLNPPVKPKPASSIARASPAPASEWDIAVGETVLRRDLHARHGGAWYGGMEPAVRSNSVLLFTNPSEGEVYGYNYDGWQPDGIFHYTGDGQVGPQDPDVGGNAALLAAKAKGRTVRVFRSEDTYTTYLGVFELLEPPYFKRPAPDRDRDMRDVLVFRLQPVGEVLTDEADAAPSAALLVDDIPLEASNTEGYVQQRPREPAEAVRREADLVKRYAEWLEGRGAQTRRQRIRLPGASSLYTDLYDITSEELVEAKADASRTAVREGFGQVLDYSRYVAHKTKALLLPSRPSADMVTLLADYGVGVIWESAGDFIRA